MNSRKVDKMMTYTPVHAVWEITYACNMRCKHCGSGCGEKYPDELSTREALGLCDDLAELGLKRLTLSGGEPFLREDWSRLARRLTENGIVTNIITNGWLLDERTLEEARDAGIVNIGVSIDGLKDTHDFIRKAGSFDRVLGAMELMNKKNISCCANTSVNRRNLPELVRLKKVLIEKGVDKWQFQVATPMGNLLEHKELIIEPGEMDEIIDFIYDTSREGEIEAYVSDDIGYYHHKEMAVRKKNAGKDEIGGWAGCHAGKSVIGIRVNGDITGCLSLRDKKFIEDNIRRVPLKEIWTRPGAFAWNREFDMEKLTGFCAKCQYSTHCKGGCGGLRYFFNDTLFENRYCSFFNAMKKLEKQVEQFDDVAALIDAGKKCAGEKAFQAAEQYFSRAHDLEPENLEVMAFLGYVHYFLRNYSISERFNRKILNTEPKNAYANKGLGLCLAKSGRLEKGLAHLFKAVELEPGCPDYYMDLATTLSEHNKPQRALEVIQQMRNFSPELKTLSEEMCRALEQKAGN